MEYGRRSGALLAAEVEDKARFSFGSNGVDFRLGLNVVVWLSLAGGNSYTGNPITRSIRGIQLAPHTPLMRACQVGLAC
jgi:hypothetical protein